MWCRQILESIFRITNVRYCSFLYFHHHFETSFRGWILSKNSCILAKNAHFLIFEDVCGLKNTSTVFINTLNVFSDIKLTCNYKGSHWKTLFPKLIVILHAGKYFEPFVSVYPPPPSFQSHILLFLQSKLFTVGNP